MTASTPHKIGLVVGKPFNYSETFYASDVKLWQQMGYKVQVFPIYPDMVGNRAQRNYRLPPAPLSPTLIKRVFQIIKASLKLLLNIASIPQVSRFIHFERQDKIPVKQIIARIYANQHILLRKDLDILIFGYGNLAVTRENLGKSLNAKTIVSFKGFDISIYPYQYSKTVFNSVFAKNFLFYFVSQGLHQKAKSIGFPKDKSVHYIPAYIDETTMPSPKESLMNNDPPEILVVGRLHWKKAHIYLILALNLLHKKGHKIKLTIIGNGDMYEQLFFAIRNLGLTEWVTFRGALSKKFTLESMRQSDLLVQPSISEGTPNVVLEAQYLRLPCIAADWLGVEELIRHKENGWVVEKRRPGALADQIEEVLGLSIDEKNKIVLNGQSNISDKFNSQVQKIAFQTLFEEAMSHE